MAQISAPSGLRRPGRDAPPALGVALVRKGFRAFFLLAAVFGALAVPLWVVILSGQVSSNWLPAAQLWHAHEMVFGYTTAVIAGFLLTAVANWTGREVLIGPPLLALCLLWLAARVSLLSSGVPAPIPVALLDIAFLPVLAGVLVRPLLQARNRRNYVMIAILLGLAVANAVTHLDAAGILPGWGRRMTLGAIHLIVLLMLLVSGRIVPIFTRNVTHQEGIRNLPILDRLALGAAGVVLVCDLVWGDSGLTPAVSAAAGVLVFLRARHWGARGTLRYPLLWILHVGHAFIGVGLLLKAFTPLFPRIAGSSLHAFTAGAIGCLTLGMMARVSLGHTGRMIVADRPTSLALGAMLAAGVVRVAAPLSPAWYLDLVAVSAGCWSVSFALFLWRFTPILLLPRVDGVAG